MPSLTWLKAEFSYGYDSGNVLSLIPGLRRLREEKIIGGSYRNVFHRAALPYLRTDSKVLELGPGRGSWSRAILSHIPDGELHTCDFQDVSKWLDPGRYGGRLVCHQVEDNSFRTVPDDYFDFFWSFGVLCHNNLDVISEILRNALPKMKPGAHATHQYADWQKLDAFGWERGKVPIEFKNKPDEEIWWPRNTRASMTRAASQAGWNVVTEDLDLVARDSIIVLTKTCTRATQDGAVSDQPLHP